MNYRPYDRITGLLFYSMFIFFAGVSFLCSLVMYFLPRRWAKYYPVYAARLNRWVCNTFDLRHEIVGTIPDKPVIVAALHQSLWDTSSFNEFIPGCAYVLKREIMYYPFVGTYLWYAGMVYVDRKSGADAMRQMLAGAKRVVLDEKRVLIIFPEGTRTVPGRYNKLHPGVYLLQRELKVPVVPLVLDSGMYWPSRSAPKAAGVIRLQFQKAIEPGLDRRGFMAELERALYGGGDRLLKERHPQYYRKLLVERREKPADEPPAGARSVAQKNKRA